MTADLFHLPAAPIDSDMPCISLWQPYASLIACGAKVYETRHWAPPDRLIGRRIAIHAAKRRPTRDEIAYDLDDVPNALGGAGWELRIPYGAVVCTATLEQAWQVRGQGLNRTVDVRAARPPFTEQTLLVPSFGDASTGRWLWELGNVRVLAEPDPLKGHQGWFIWSRPGHVREEILPDTADA